MGVTQVLNGLFIYACYLDLLVVFRPRAILAIVSIAQQPWIALSYQWANQREPDDESVS